MQEMIKIIIGIVVLGLGILIGNVLRNQTREEIKSGRKWFKILVFVGLIGGVVGLVLQNDVLLFSMFFIAIVSSRSLVGKS